MASHAWDDLPYGHFGRARYYPEEKIWRFLKSPGQPRVLETLGLPRILHENPQDSKATTPDRSAEFPSKRHERQIKDLIRRFTELQPANKLLRPLLQGSEAVEGSTATHDPVKGQLLDFGRVFDESLRRYAQLAAFATGPTGSDLRLVQVRSQKQGWQDSKNTWVEVPIFAGAECVWRGEGAPVQQIRFAQPIEGGECLLAVRMITRTVIFKPVLRKSGPGRMDANELCEVHMNMTGGVPHSDIAFNPWFTRQFAIADQSGGWSVWEFTSRESRRADCLHTCKMDQSPLTSSVPLTDGWARIFWVRDPNTVLLAMRSRVLLYDVPAGLRIIPETDLESQGGIDWILAASPLPGHLDKFCVLTNTHLNLFVLQERDNVLRTRSMLHIRHQRSPDDITLNHLLWEDGEDVMIMLRCALNETTVLYRLTVCEEATVVLHNPVMMPLSHFPVIGSKMTGVSFYNVQHCAIASKRHAETGGCRASALRDSESRVTSFAMLSNDLSVLQQLYVARPSTFQLCPGDFPAWNGRLPSSSTRLIDAFVVEEDIEELEGQTPSVDLVARKKVVKTSFRMNDAKVIVDFGLLADRIEHGDAAAEDVADIVERARDLLNQQSTNATTPMMLLYELTEGDHTTGDVDGASEAVKNLSTLEPRAPMQPYIPADEVDGEPVRLGIRLVATPSVLGLTAVDGGATLSATYDGIVSQWISNLSSKVPARVRMTKEILARRMAADLTLASNVLHPVAESGEELPSQETTLPESQSQTESQSQKWSLPVRGITSSQASQSLPILPTPSPTATPSLITSSSRTSLVGPAAEVSRLSRYATFTKPAPTSLSRPLAKILAHWQPGTDPEFYDWVSTSRTINREVEAEEADSQLTEKERARLARKAEKMLRRQRKENAASQQRLEASSQMPELAVSASQPTRAATQAKGAKGHEVVGLASSQSVGGPAIASQAAPGRFGGRPPPAKRAKRKQGF